MSAFIQTSLFSASNTPRSRPSQKDFLALFLVFQILWQIQIQKNSLLPGVSTQTIHKEEFPYSIGSPQKDSSETILDIDTRGNIIFGGTLYDKSQFPVGLSSTAFLAFYSFQGIAYWVKQYLSVRPIDNGSFIGARMLNFDFSPDDQYIGALAEMKVVKSPKDFDANYLLINSTDGEVLYSLADTRDKSDQNFIKIEYSKAIILRGNMELFLFSEDTAMKFNSREMTLGKLNFYAKTLTLFTLQNTFEATAVTYNIVRGLFVEAWNQQIYIGMSIKPSANLKFTAIAVFDFLSETFSNIVYNKVLNSDIDARVMQEISYFNDGQNDFIGGCLSEVDRDDLGIFSAPFQDYLAGTLTMYKLSPTMHSYSCYGLTLTSPTISLYLISYNDIYYLLIFDLSSPTSVVKRELGGFDSSLSPINHAMIFDESTIYATGVTTLAEFGLSYAYEQVFLMKFGQTETCLTLTESETTESVTSYAGIWVAVTPTERALDQASMMLLGEEAYATNLLNFKGLSPKQCFKEANIDIPTIFSMEYQIGGTELIQFYDGFSFEGEELRLEYSGEYIYSTNLSFDFIYFSPMEKYISIYTTDDSLKGDYLFNLKGTLLTGDYTYVQFRVILLSNPEMLMVSTVEFSSSLEDQTCHLYEEIQYTLPSLKNVYSQFCEIEFRQLLSFVTFSEDTFTFRPFELNELGAYQIFFNVKEFNETTLIMVRTSFNFIVEILPEEQKAAPPPEFKSAPPSPLMVPQGEALKEALPSVTSANPYKIKLQHYNNSEEFIMILDNSQLLIDSSGQAMGVYMIDLNLFDLVTKVSSPSYTLFILIGEPISKQPLNQDMRKEELQQTSSQMKAEITDVSENGLVNVTFDQELNLKNSQLKDELNSQTIIETYIMDEDDIKVDIENRGVIITVFSNSILIDLHLSDPFSITNSEANQSLLTIHFLRPQEIISNNGSSLSIDYSTLKSYIPTQKSNDLGIQLLERSKTAINAFLTSMVFSTVATSILFSTSISLLWPFLNFLQIVVDIPLICEQMPSNVLQLNEIFIQMANADLLPLSQITDKIFVFEEAREVNEQFSSVGYEHFQLIPNLSSIFYYIIVVLMFRTLLQLFMFFAKKNQRVLKLHQYCQNSGFYFQFLNEIYLILLLCACINTYDFKWSSFSYILNNIFCFGSIIVATLYPMILLRKILSAMKQLYTNQEVTDPIFVDLKSSSQTIVMPLVFVAQRYFFVVICLAVPQGLKISLFTFLELAKTAYLVSCYPYDTLGRNRLELFNEFTILGISVLLFLFQDLTTPFLQYQIGWLIIIGSLFNFLINNALIVLSLVTATLKRFKRFCQRFRERSAKTPITSLTTQNLQNYFQESPRIVNMDAFNKRANHPVTIRPYQQNFFTDKKLRNQLYEIEDGIR